LTTLYSFCAQAGCPDGANPHGGLIQGSDGNFYGTTSGWDVGSGQVGYGTVFKITSGGVLTTLHSFSGLDGAIPVGALVQAANGNMYGTTGSGGSFSCPDVSNYGCGTVFQIAPSGKFRSLFSFSGGNGSYPASGLVSVNERFYGTTQYGGTSGNCTNGCGTVFAINAAGALTALHNFDGYDGATPVGALTLSSSNGDLYGTTYTGGGCFGLALGCGTVFEITTTGVFTALLSFNKGGFPDAGLLLATDGNFYGTSTDGGYNWTCPSGGYGTIFRVTPAGKLTTLYTFTGGADGSCPWGGLVEGTDDNLYGTAASGGAVGAGTVFALSVGL
jgi:uncharacterized repeat protein (TIGR03803 family)